jgi:hypothetical protein
MDDEVKKRSGTQQKLAVAAVGYRSHEPLVALAYELTNSE